MSREIRKVPKDWEHPKDERGEYLPLYKDSFQAAFDEWYIGLLRWIGGTSEDYDDRFYTRDARGYTEYAGSSPSLDVYRERDWTEEEASCFQIYQTVSEGTPVSPVFESLIAMENWLVEQGYSRNAAQNFCKEGHAFSITFDSNNGIKEDIHALD